MAELKFSSSRTKPLLRLAFSALAAVLFVWIAQEFGWKAFYLALTVPLVNFLGAVVDLLPGSSWLRLDDEGLAYTRGFRSTTLRWQSVERFRVAKQHDTWPAREIVVFDLAPNAERSRWTAWRRSIYGYDGELPDTYGHTAEELVVLLNRCLAARTQPPPE